METTLQILQWIGGTAYIGSLWGLTLLAWLGILTEKPSLRTVSDAFQALGVGMGLSLGALIFSSLILHFLQHGSFGMSEGVSQWQQAQFALFFIFWISHIRLEIWTLEPLRKRQGASEEELRPLLLPVARQSLFNSSILLLCGVLSLQ